MRATILVFLVFLTLSLAPGVLAVDPLAHGKFKNLPGTLVFTPDPAQSGGQLVLAEGDGYVPSNFAYWNVFTPNSLYAGSQWVDATGHLSFTFQTAEPGLYEVRVYQQPNGKKQMLAALAYLGVR